MSGPGLQAGGAFPAGSKQDSAWGKAAGSEGVTNTQTSGLFSHGSEQT